MTEVARYDPVKGLLGGLLMVAVGVGFPLLPILMGTTYEHFIETSRHGPAFVATAPLAAVLGVSIGAWALWEVLVPGHPSIAISQGRIRFRMPGNRDIPLEAVEDVTLLERRDPLDSSLVTSTLVEIVLKSGERRRIGAALYRQTPQDIRRTLLKAAGLPKAPVPNAGEGAA
ncbi:hypothetical protein [Caulobacter mirabilis]|uniref:Uncharacterized protein n=1 Tax=Caulobacter mirabilis TaxID=69666 RepID=A0A2D2AXQ0_9CAUL|nr:hypothetical protein [Caulobacter mirabilis]ATQ42753.1 hypothetical protein CSW64_10190 [Caulobacter mirabilis]